MKGTARRVRGDGTRHWQLAVRQVVWRAHEEKNTVLATAALRKSGMVFEEFGWREDTRTYVLQFFISSLDGWLGKVNWRAKGRRWILNACS